MSIHIRLSHIFMPSILLMLLSIHPHASADTVYRKEVGGKEQVYAEKVIVFSETPSTRWLYHTDGIVRERYGPFIPGESFRATISSPEERNAIIEGWKREGYTAEITHNSGLKTIVYNVYHTFTQPPTPSGFGYGEVEGQYDCLFITLKWDGFLFEEQFEFHKLAGLEMSGTSVKAVFGNGQSVTGQLQDEFYRNPLIGWDAQAQDAKYDKSILMRPAFAGYETYGPPKPIRYFHFLSEIQSLRFVAFGSTSATGDRDFAIRPPTARQTIHRSQYVIPKFKEIMGSIISDVDVTLEATEDPNVLKTSGRQEFALDALDLNATKPARIQDLTWNPGARHTLKGTLRIGGYTFVSNAADPLVFRMVLDQGYVYQRGRGSIVTPTGEEVVLGQDSSRPAAGLRSVTENVEVPTKVEGGLPEPGDVLLARYVHVKCESKDPQLRAEKRRAAESIRADVERGQSLDRAADTAGFFASPLRWYKKGALPKPIEEAAFALKEGGCSVVDTDAGFFVVQVFKHSTQAPPASTASAESPIPSEPGTEYTIYLTNWSSNGWYLQINRDGSGTFGTLKPALLTSFKAGVFNSAAVLTALLADKEAGMGRRADTKDRYTFTIKEVRSGMMTFTPYSTKNVSFVSNLFDKAKGAVSLDTELEKLWRSNHP